MFRYTITLDPHAHLLRVSLELTPPQDAVTLHMPSWTSGSYLIRDYAGRIRGPRSSTGTLVQTDKCHWTVSGLTPGATLRIEWEAFTYSVGIHDAWLDDIRGFYNPAAVLLIPEGIDAPCLLDFSDCRFVPHCSLEPIGTHSFAASCTRSFSTPPSPSRLQRANTAFSTSPSAAFPTRLSSPAPAPPLSTRTSSCRMHKPF